MADREQTGGNAGTCVHGHTFGGQAVIEGVMMRGRHSWGVAVRRPSGGIARVAYTLDAPGASHRSLRLPVVRGVVALYESISLGIKALGISANIGLEEAAEGPRSADARPAAAPALLGETGLSAAAVEATGISSAVVPGSGEVERAHGTEPRGRGGLLGGNAPKGSKESGESSSFGWKEMTVTVLVAVAMAVVLFVVIPLVVVKHFESTFSNRFVFNLVEGLIRIAIFLVYIVGISLIPDLRRVFQYHGAEHKVIHAYEACGKPDAEHARGYSTLHPRCGTGFLLLVMVIAVFVFAIVGKPALPWLVLSRIIGIPVIVGISYEIGIKWAGKHPDGFFARILLWPGLQLQRLTTREPSPDQLEVAAAALDDVIRLDGLEERSSGSLEGLPAQG